jgi:DNA helicase-2/ATP-dependent DNA helicase PcrA
VPIDVSTLNGPQREAVLHGDGPLLVLAGAGSGKTRVITTRVGRMVEKGVPARRICALSFTNKAAGEMRERVERLVGPRDAEALTLSTFHSLGLTMLKAEREAMGFGRGFTIYDGADQLGVVREVLREVKVDDRRFDPKAILHRISRAKNAFIGPAAYDRKGGPEPAEGEARQRGTSWDDYDEVTRLVYPRYQAALRAFAAVDFDDLITATVELLERDPEVRARWAERFWYLLVDEYQDTNRAQLMLVRALAPHHNVTVVGDDDQSIYAWRGAEASNILDFEQHFPGAQIIKLEQNYRSTPTILAAANAVIRNNLARRDKTLFSDRAAGPPITLVACADPESEAAFVCDEIERLRLEDHRRHDEVAILYRSNIQARPLEEALLARRLPYDLVGGQEFYERTEIKDVMAYLKLAINSRDEIALRRVVNYPARGIGTTTVERAAQRASAEGSTMYRTLEQLAGVIDGEVASASKRQKAAIEGFVAVIAGLRQRLEGEVAEAVRWLVETIGLHDDLRAAAASASAAQRRIDNIEDFIKSLAERQRKKPGLEALREYLHFLSLKASDDDAAHEGGQRVTLTTLHGAKGLEWPVVFLVGLEAERLPHARTLYPQGPDAELGAEASPDVGEERRLAYVGITRARALLYLTRCRERRKHGKERARTPSRFLAEIPAELVVSRDLAAEAQAPASEHELAGFWAGLLKD